VSQARWNVTHPELQDGPDWPALCEEQIRLDSVESLPLSLTLVLASDYGSAQGR
jgi:hypothetical protein